MKIAIIEDDATIRESYAFLLGNEPDLSICGTYGSYEDAVEDIARHSPDVILVDVQLPGIRGVDALPHLKKLVPGVHLLILTVFESEEIIFTALKNGASGFLTKNTSPEKIIEAIREVINGGGAMSAGVARLVMQTFRKNTDTPLTKRELEILEALAEGKSRGRIAATLFIDLETVKTHIKNIYHKLDVNSKEQAIKVARESKYI